MDNTNDTNKPGTELDIAPPSEIELATDTPTPIQTEQPIHETVDADEPTEAVEESSDDESERPEMSAGLSRLELESLIQRYMDDVEKLKSQIKSQKEMYNASFEGDAEYAQADEAAKDAKKKASAAKQRITQQPAVKDAEMRMSELKDEMKDVQEAISGLAEQYQTVAGTNQIVQDDGQVLEIVRNFKVIRKKS
jgi:vacuolar-type H+-ATPase subunit I/STV1